MILLPSSAALSMLVVICVCLISASAHPTPSPVECSFSDTRHRRPWQSLTESERDLYINGFRELADQDRTQLFTEAHLVNGGAIHGTVIFLPWHRKFIQKLESAIRSLGGVYSCFSMPYWDWSHEPTPNDGLPVYMFDSGLCADSLGACLPGGCPFGEGNYAPYAGDCLIRDIDYWNDWACHFSNPEQLMNIIASSNGDFTSLWNALEGYPHAAPHICIAGHMVTFSSPDDPIFYLHHTFVDYLWAVFQSCHNYDDQVTTSFSDAYSGDLNEQLPLSPLGGMATAGDVMDITDMHVSYEKSYFWEAAMVDNNCVHPPNDDWFTSTPTLHPSIGPDTPDEDQQRLVSTDSDPIARQTQSQLLYEQIVAEVEARHADSGGRSRRSSSSALSSDSADDSGSSSAQAIIAEITSEWAFQMCEIYEEQSGQVCELPDEDFDDCSDMRLNPRTNDIDITLDELLAKEGITACMRAIRREFFAFAETQRNLLGLCAGCYDPFCDRSAFVDKCEVINSRKSSTNSNSNNDRRAAAPLPLVPPASATVDVYFVISALAAVLTVYLAAKAVRNWMCGEKGQTASQYGKVRIESETETEIETEIGAKAGAGN